MLPQQQPLLCFTYLNVSLTLFMDKRAVLKMDRNIKVKKAISRIYKSRSSVVLITCPNDQVQAESIEKFRTTFIFFFTFLLSISCKILHIDVCWGKKHKPSVILVKRFTKVAIKFKIKKLIRNQISATIRVVIYCIIKGKLFSDEPFIVLCIYIPSLHHLINGKMNITATVFTKCYSNFQ